MLGSDWNVLGSDMSGLGRDGSVKGSDGSGLGRDGVFLVVVGKARPPSPPPQ